MPGTLESSLPQINVGAVTYDGPLPNLKAFAVNALPIADFMIHNHYERDQHRYMAGLTAPEPFNGSTVGVVQLANPTVLWIAEWTACRAGEHPPVPDPTPPQGWVLLDVNISVPKITAGPAGDGVFRIEGTYVYCKTSPDADVKRFITYEVEYPYAPWLLPGIFRKVPLQSVLTGLLTEQAGGGFDGGVVGAQDAQGLTSPLNFVVGTK